MSNRMKANPLFIAVVFGTMLLACLALAFLFPINARAQDGASDPAPLIWTTEHGTITLRASPCANAKVLEIIAMNGIEAQYNTADIHWDGKDDAGCWSFLVNQGKVCVISEGGGHGDIDLRHFKPLTRVEKEGTKEGESATK